MFGDEDMRAVEQLSETAVGVETADKSGKERRVYITNFTNFEFHSADKYGKVYYLTSGNINLANLSAVIRKVLPKIKSASPEDYLVLTGASPLGAVIFTTWLNYHGKVNLLIYHRKKEDYVKTTVNKEDFAL